MTIVSKPWDRLPKESKPAFLAFVAYRDLGPGRTMIKAYRYAKGTPTVRQVPGFWKAWSKTHHWAARAEAWDAKLDKTKTDAAVKVAAQAGKRWQELREEQAQKSYDLGQAILRQAAYLIGFPVVTETVSQDDKAVTYTAVDPAVLTNGARLAKLGDELVWAAIDQGLAAEEGSAPLPTSATIRVDVVMREADRILAEWRASKRAQMVNRPPSGLPDPSGPET